MADDPGVTGELRDAFMDAKNSLVEVMRARRFYELAVPRLTEAEPNFFRTTPPLSQTSFLKHAYVGLVWLREVANRRATPPMKDTIDAWMQQAVANVGGDELILCSTDDRSGAEGVLRTIRNAIAHGTVSFGNDGRSGLGPVRFSDTYKASRSVVEIGAPGLGYLTDEYIYAVSNALYGEPRAVGAFRV